MSIRGEVRTLASVLKASVVVVEVVVRDQEMDVVDDDNEKRCVLSGAWCSGEYVLTVDGGCEWEVGRGMLPETLPDSSRLRSSQINEVLRTVRNKWDEKIISKRDVRANHKFGGCREGGEGKSGWWHGETRKVVEGRRARGGHR
eukprot:6491245-Amphidinium_carterae.2